MKTKITKTFNQITDSYMEHVVFICDGCNKKFGKIGRPPLCGSCWNKKENSD